MSCTKERPCHSLTALVQDGVVNYVNEINLPGYSEHAFTGLVVKGRTYLVAGKPVIDSHILNYCPGCGRRFMEFIDGYAPPLVIEKSKNIPSPPTIIV